MCFLVQRGIDYLNRARRQSLALRKEPSKKKLVIPSNSNRSSKSLWASGKMAVVAHEGATTHWNLGQDARGVAKEFVFFLSHYKVEAGGVSRLINDEIEKALPDVSEPCYLDSDNLADLSKLFREGVQKSEAVLVIATKGIFSRPCTLLGWEPIPPCPPLTWKLTVMHLRAFAPCVLRLPG